MINFKITPLFLILVGSLIFIVIIISKIIPPSAPDVRFDGVDGTVYLDEKKLGETKEEVFKKLPRRYCKGTHTLKLETSEKKYSWATYPVDCNYKVILYSATIEQAPLTEIEMQFFVRGTDIKLSGRLFFNDEYYDDINSGEYVISAEECKKYYSVKIEFDNRYVSWINKREWCEEHGIIKHTISEAEYNSMLNISN